MSDLKVFMLSIVHRRVRSPQRQASAAVACTSQKRAAELFGTTTSDVQNYGTVLDEEHDIAKMALAEPEVVFVATDNGGDRHFIRLADLDKRTDDPGADEPSAIIVLPDRTDDLLGTPIRNDAFGKIKVSRVSGRRSLFMVDYPQEHYMVLEISTAELRRAHSNDRVFEGHELIRVALSEIQWAQFISAPNTSGGPCTLERYIDRDGTFKHPKLPDNHAASGQTFAKKVQATADKAAMSLDQAQVIIDTMLAGGSVRKADLQKAREALQAARRGISSNLSFVVKQAEEAIETASTSARAEVDAHIEYAMARLGERALGDRLEQALDAGADLVRIGRDVIDAMTEPAKE
jgi:hypothetical protein